MNYTIYAAITALLLGIGNIVQKRGALNYQSHEQFILDTAVPNIILSIIFFLLSFQNHPSITIEGILIITLAAVISAGLGKIFFQKAVYYDSSSVAAIGSLTTEPTTSALIAAIILGEIITTKTLGALFLIIVSVIIMYKDIEVNKKAYLYGATSGFLAALSAIIVKISFSHSIDPFFAAAWYLLISSAYSIIYYATKSHKFLRPSIEPNIFISYTLFGFSNFTSYMAFKLGPIANSKIIILTYPAIILILSHILGYKAEKVTLKKYVSTVLSLVAAAIILL